MLNVAVTLGSLCAEVDQVASEEEVVPRLNGHGVAHECAAVTDESCGHGTGDTVVGTLVSFTVQSDLLVYTARATIRRNMALLDVHLGVFLSVHDGRNGNTEVGGRAPEVCIVEAMVSQYPHNISSLSQPLVSVLFKFQNHKYALAQCASSCSQYSSSF